MPAKRLIIVLTVVLLSVCATQAKKIEGYIVTQDLDTINGKIILPKFNRYSGGYSITSFNQVSLHYEVWFKSNQEKRFKRYEATDIVGFGFVFSSYPYFFKSFTIESNTPFKRVKQKDRFLKLSYSGTVCLYYDIVQTKIEGMQTAHPSQSYDDIVTFKEYYLYNDSIGLTKVEKTKETLTIKHLLQHYQFNEDFISKLPNDFYFEDIALIMLNYRYFLAFGVK